MKIKTFNTLSRLALGCALGTSAYAQTTAFTYQGKLEDNGRQATGLYQMTFALYDQPASVTPISGAVATQLLPVTNGLFTTLLDFGSTPFNGSARWLQVSVRTNGSTAAAVALVPRTFLASVPYATYAQKAGSVADGGVTSAQIASGAAVKSLNGLKNDVALTAGSNVTLVTNGNSLVISATGSSASNAWTANGNNLYYTRGKVGVGLSTPAASLDVLGNWDGEQGALNLTGSKPSLRFSGGADSANQSWLTVLGSRGSLDFYRRTGPGAWNPTMMLETNSDISFGWGTKLNFGQQTRQMLNLWGEYYGVGVQSSTLYQRTGGGFAWYKGGKHSDAYGDPGTNGRPLMSLDDNYLNVRGAANEQAYIGGNGILNDVQVGSLNPTVTSVALWNGASYNWMDLGAQNINYFGSQNQLNVADNFTATVRCADFTMGHSSRRGTPGRALVDLGTELHVNFAGDWNRTVIGGCVTSVRALEITGGCDLAEPFPMSEKRIPEGSVVVIDEANPGHLKLATSAYDTRVAGIISGANGINAGISLKQEGALDQGQNVALTGRVYVKTDASFGAIKPGDLLTTSSTPGHAMKVTDSTRSQGAILGKAMTSLKEGAGMVLVLVTLQ